MSHELQMDLLSATCALILTENVGERVFGAKWLNIKQHSFEELLQHFFEVI